MKFFGKEFLFNGFRIFHAGDKPTPSDIAVIPYVLGTQTVATGTWTGKTDEITSLEDGISIRYWLPYNGSGNATLNLTLADGTTTGAINCYYKGSTRLTTHFSAGSVILLTYRANAVVAGTTVGPGWWAVCDYNSDSKVSQPAAITTAGNFPVLLAYSTATTAVTNAVKKTASLLYNPSTKVLTVPTVKAALNGNADTATKATQDGNGKNIADTYATKDEVTAAQGAKVYVSATKPTGTIATGSLWL